MEDAMEGFKLTVYAMRSELHLNKNTSMNLDEFTLLTGEYQIDIIYTSGEFVGKRQHLQHCIHLYQVGDLYAEVFFRKKDDTIWKVGAFDHPVLLQPYLDQIDISSLLK